MHNRNGQAKVFLELELESLLINGFEQARDLALFAFCFYTACRISEARKAHFNHVFFNHQVRDIIIIPKCNTKGQQKTREIPTHPKLKQCLQIYLEQSHKLLELKKMFGYWSPQNLNEDNKLQISYQYICRYCGHQRLRKNGIYKGANGNAQKYQCQKCHRYSHEHLLTPLDKPRVELYEVYGVKASGNYGFLGENPDNPYLFPGVKGKGCLGINRSIVIFEQAFEKLGIMGASTHSCRRTALTILHRENVVLRVIQAISGHEDLGALQRYLEVSQEQVVSAVNILG